MSLKEAGSGGSLGHASARQDSAPHDSAHQDSAPHDSARQASARVQAVFELRCEGRERVAAAAGELVHALQQVAALPGCECDLDVSLDVDADNRA